LFEWLPHMCDLSLSTFIWLHVEKGLNFRYGGRPKSHPFSGFVYLSGHPNGTARHSNISPKEEPKMRGNNLYSNSPTYVNSTLRNFLPVGANYKKIVEMRFASRRN
jgi:hypothetical protein